MHLVRVEYTDGDGVAEDTLIWEREQGRDLLKPHALPRMEDQPRMPTQDLDALVRSARWSAFAPFLRKDGSGVSAQIFSEPKWWWNENHPRA